MPFLYETIPASNLIQKESTAIRRFNSSFLRIPGIRKRPLLVSEKFTLEKILRDTPQVDIHKRLPCPARKLMQGMRHHILSRTILSSNQYVGIRSRHTHHLRFQFLHGRAFANHSRKHILAVVILGSAIMCVATKRIMRAATYLLFVLFGVAGVFFLLDYTYLGAAQIAVYAGGITILYVFAIQLVSKRTLQGLLEHVKGSKVIGRALVCLVGFVTLAVIVLKNHFIDLAATVADTEVPMEQVGSALVGADKYGYVLPFEFISVFLLACIIGGILIARKEDKK